MIYKLIKNFDGILRLNDNGTNTTIPLEGNGWAEYQTWLDVGNTPEPADIPDLAQVKAAAIARVVAEADRQMELSGFVPESRYAGAMVADIAFIVKVWEEAGKPDEMPPTIAERVNGEAAEYGITPAQMVTIWRAKWLEMRDGFAPILAQRRQRLLAIEAATDAAGVEYILSTIEGAAVGE